MTDSAQAEPRACAGLIERLLDEQPGIVSAFSLLKSTDQHIDSAVALILRSQLLYFYPLGLQ